MPHKDPAAARAYQRAYRQRPDVKERKRAEERTPVAQARRRRYNQTPEAREASRKRHQDPANRAASNISKARSRERDRELADAYKVAHGCIDCGYNAFPAALHFDHRDPATKTADVAQLIGTGRRWETILIEIAKCDVRCANCHAVRTWEQTPRTQPTISERRRRRLTHQQLRLLG